MLNKTTLAVIIAFACILTTGCLTTQKAEEAVDTTAEARDTRRKADLAEIKTALEMYYSDLGQYPPSADFGGLTQYLVPAYINPLPDDPSEGESYSYSGSANSYTLTAPLETSGEAYQVFDAH